MIDATALSSLSFALFGAATRSPGAAQTRGSVYTGLIPFAGPPDPTSGPLPPSSAAGVGCAGAGGIAAGTSAGATSCFGGVFETGRLSPPLLPSTAGPVVFGKRRNPIRSAGTSGECDLPKIRVNAAGEMRNRTSAIATSTCRAIDSATGRDRFALDVDSSGVRELRSVFISTGTRRSATPLRSIV